MSLVRFQDGVDVLWEAQKIVFRSMDRHIATTINFSQLLPDLLRLQFFTNEQLTQNNNFHDSTSSVIVQALGERINTHRPIFPLLLVTLRRVNSSLVDEIHHQVSAQMSKSCVTYQQVSSQIPKPCVTSGQQRIRIRTEEKLPQTPFASRSHGLHVVKPSSPNTIKPASPYFRRPFSIHAPTDQDNIENIRHNYIAPPRGAYFSKASSRKVPSSDVIPSYKFCVRGENSTNNEIKASQSASKSSGLFSTMTSPIKNINLELKYAKKQQFQRGTAYEKPMSFQPYCSTNQAEFDFDQLAGHEAETRIATPEKITSLEFKAAVETKKKSELRGGVKSPSPQSVTPTISYTTCNGTNSYNQNGPSAGNQTPNYDHCRVFSTSKNNELCHQIDLLQLIRQKFSLHSPTKTILTPDIDFCHISQHCDVNALVRELVAHCIISVRTAWLIRRCTKATERFREYLQMLTSLKLNDMTDLMNWCHKNRAFLDEFIFATMPKRGIENDAIKNATLKLGDEVATVTSLIDNVTLGFGDEVATVTSSTDNVTLGRRDEIAPVAPSSSTHKSSSAYDGEVSDVSDGSIDPAPVPEEDQKHSTEVTLRNRLVAKERCSFDQVVNSDADKTINEMEQIMELDATDAAGSSLKKGRKQKLAEQPTSSKLLRLNSHNEQTKFQTELEQPLELANSETSFINKLLLPVSSVNKELNKSSASIIFKNTQEKLVGNTTKLTCRENIKTAKSLMSMNQDETSVNLNSELLLKKSPVQIETAAVSTSPMLTSTPINLNITLKNYSIKPASLATSQAPVKAANKVTQCDAMQEEATIPLYNIDLSLSPTPKKANFHRVSFSDSPPVEIPPETFSDPPRSVHEKINKPSSQIKDLTEVDRHNKTESTDTTSVALPVLGIEKWDSESSVFSSNTLNTADYANELLVDILEEIEADNISLSNCLKEMVEAEMISHDMALLVNPNYLHKSFEQSNRGTQLDFQDDAQDCFGRLVDVLTNLDWKTLRKCHKLILRKLCRLSSKENYDSLQLAAKLNDSSLWGEDAIDSKLHKQQNHDKKRNISLSDHVTSEIVKASGHPTASDEPKTSARDPLSASNSCDTKQLLSKLTDEKILAARQVWGILGAEENFEQTTLLRKCLVNLRGPQLQNFHRIFNLEQLKTVMGKDKFDEAKEQLGASKQTSFNNFSAVGASELHGGAVCCDSIMVEKVSTSKNFEKYEKNVQLASLLTSSSTTSDFKSN